MRHDGFEVLERLKGSAPTSEIPVIILSARTGADDWNRGLELGAVDYITKPINIPDVKERVKKCLSLAHG